MPRPAGLPKTGGRKKGTPNKKTLALQDALTAAGLDVPIQITELLPQLEPTKRVDVLLELMAYLYPKRKAIEQQIEVETTSTRISTMTPEERRRRLERLDEIRRIGGEEEEDAERPDMIQRLKRLDEFRRLTDKEEEDAEQSCSASD